MLTIPEFVNADVVHRADQYGQQFETARPFRHVVIDNFLSTSVADALLRDFPACTDPTKLVNEFGAPNPKSAVFDVRGIGGAYVDIDNYIQTASFLKLMSQITGIPNLCYDPWYYGAGTHENFHTAGLYPHYDFNIHPKTAQHRRLNAIVYLNKDWDPAWGGSIRFHSDPYDLHNDQVIDIAPEFNRCVIFETNERSWHSVPPVNLPEDKRHLSRKSFTIYLYTDTRPDEEIATEHGTVYVPPNLPEHIRAGHTLTEDDVREIFANIERRNVYLRGLYKREYRYSEHISRQAAEIKELKRASYVPVLGYGRITEVRSPIFPDRWMETKLDFSLHLMRPVTAMTLFGYRPEDWGGVEVSLTVGDRTASGSSLSGEFEIPLSLGASTTGVVDVVVTANTKQRPPNSADQRELSILINRIELTH